MLYRSLFDIYFETVLSPRREYHLELTGNGVPACMRAHVFQHLYSRAGDSTFFQHKYKVSFSNVVENGFSNVRSYVVVLNMNVVETVWFTRSF